MFAVLVKTDQRSLDVKMLEQLTRMAGVFSSNPIHCAKNVYCALTDILEVSDWGGDKVKIAHNVYTFR